MRHVPAAPVLFGALLGVLAAWASPAALVLNKCCPQGDLLGEESGVIGCRGNDAPRANVLDVPPRPLSASDVNESGLGELRSWLDWRSNVFDAEDLEPSHLSLVDLLPSTALVRHGVQPCTSYHQQKVFGLRQWSARYRLFTNGTLFLNLTSFSGKGMLSLNSDEYCMDVFHSKDGFMNVILSCPCARVPCFRKCCRSDKDYVFGKDGNLACTRTVDVRTKGWRPFRGQENEPVHHLMVNRPPQCNLSDINLKEVIRNGDPDSRLNVTALPDGSASIEDIAGAVAPGLWCGESIRLASGERVATALFCHRPTPVRTARLLAYASCLGVSVVFLALTLGVYAALPELRAQPHAKALMCHCAALVVGCVVLAAAQAGWDATGLACEFIALAIQCSYLSAFFWLSILSYDISQAFREYSKSCHSESAAQRTFRRYSLVGWGIPLLFTCATFIIVRLQRADLLPNGVIVYPNIGLHNCWFGDRAAKWMYFNGLLAGLMVINTVFYIMTTARLCGFIRNNKELMRGESCMHGTSSRLTPDKLRFWLHSRLFLVMGLLWGFDAISPALEGTLLEDDSHSFNWFILDVFNLLRGVVLFCIYCCKRKVVQKLRARAASCGLAWAAPSAAGDGEAPNARWPKRWSAWLSSGATAAAASTSATTPGVSRRSSILSVFRSRAASSAAGAAPAGRLRLSTQSTCASSGSRSPGALAHSPSPTITPIPEKCEDPFADRAAAAGGPAVTGHHAEVAAGAE